MKLISLEVQNYRNITTPTTVFLKNYTVFIGKNNEGKSNLLRALHCGVNLLSFATRATRSRPPFRMREYYDITRDYPVSPNDSSGTYFILQIEFSEDEISELEKKDITIKDSIYIKIFLDTDRGFPSFKILRKGKGINKIIEKESIIYNFINSELICTYICAVRTADQSRDVAREMIDDILQPLLDDANFRKAVKNVRKLQEPFIKEVSSMIYDELKVFLPDIKCVDIETPFSRRAFSIRDCSLWIDDGTITPLEEKGDGVQSIASICMLRNRNKNNSSLVVAIEEPEAHLHQGAIHHLRNVLREISNNSQVVITTHNPAFIDRTQMTSCHIIEGGVATRAEKIDDIRNMLGIKLSDSLIGSDFIIIVEGEDDSIVLRAYLEKESSVISSALKDGLLDVVYAGGASKISDCILFYERYLCNIVCVLDDDEAGKQAVQSIRSKGILRDRDIFLMNCNGYSVSELEDMFTLDAYTPIMKTEYGIDCNIPEIKRIIRGSRHKWSDRIEKCFLKAGKTWDDATEKSLKVSVAKKVSSNPQAYFDANKVISLRNMMAYIESQIDSRS